MAELEKDLIIGDHVNKELRNRIMGIIKDYWDCFIKEGCHRTILGYEFSIDTGDAPQFAARNQLMVIMNLALLWTRCRKF